jgi:hypothetical protein
MKAAETRNIQSKNTIVTIFQDGTDLEEELGLK